METIEGVVESVSQKAKMYSVKVNGEWYGARGTAAVNKGDTVRVEWKRGGEKDTGGFFRDIVRIEKVKLESTRDYIPSMPPIKDDLPTIMGVCLDYAFEKLPEKARARGLKPSDDVLVENSVKVANALFIARTRK